jgi:hypothetical protein
MAAKRKMTKAELVAGIERINALARLHRSGKTRNSNLTIRYIAQEALHLIARAK